jgi:hypothetical protein
MVKLTHAEMRVLEDALDMGSGYVLDFTNRSMAEFFGSEFGITIFQEKYAVKGTSKRKYLRAFLEIEDGHTVSRMLKSLWAHRESIERYRDPVRAQWLKEHFWALLAKIEERGTAPQTDAIYRFTQGETLDELVSALQRDIGANKPVAALDRLHTYCMKKFWHLLELRNVPCDRKEPLHSHVGKYVRALSQERELRYVTIQIIKNAVGVFEKFNHVRNNQSLAHDNDLIDAAEARFIYDSITAFLRFVESVEVNSLDA